jgi:hypothetical protein
VTDVSTNAPPRKPDPQCERELLINLLRTASARTRLHTNTLETIGVSLRHRQVSTEEAMAWLAEEGLLEHVQLGGRGQHENQR